MGEYIDDLFKDIQTGPSKMEEVVHAINTILENFINVVFKAVESLSNDVAGIKSELRQSLNNLNTKVQSLEGRISSMRTAPGPTMTGLTTPGPSEPFLTPPPTTPGPSEPFLTPPPTTPGPPGPPGPQGPESPPPMTGATLRMQLNSELKKAFSRMRGGEE